jgi:hypothetical protein
MAAGFPCHWFSPMMATAANAEGSAVRIDIPEGKDAIGYVWGEMVPGIGIAASRFSTASCRSWSSA